MTAPVVLIGFGLGMVGGPLLPPFDHGNDVSRAYTEIDQAMPCRTLSRACPGRSWYSDSNIAHPAATGAIMLVSRPVRTRYRRGLMTSVVNNSSAFGFSVMITTAYGILGTFHGHPSAFQVALFALGAIVAISLIEAVASRGFRHRPDTHPAEVVLLGTAANIVSVAICLAITYGVGAWLPEPLVWPLAPLLAAGVYLLVEAAELAIAEGLQQRVFGNRAAHPQQ